MEITGLPVHALVVHAAVVLIPLTALAVIVFAMVPGSRWLLRWPVAIVALACVGLAFLATTSGGSLAQARGLQPLVEVHEERGTLLAGATIGFPVLVALGATLLAGASPLASGRGTWSSPAPSWDKVLVPLLVVAALGIIVLVVLVGHSGSRAVWG